MEFIVVDKNTIENITDKKKWILGPKGDLEYIDMFGNICSSADAIAVAPETYYTLLKHKRDNITNTSTDKIHKILVECMVEHYVEFKSPKRFCKIIKKCWTNTIQQFAIMCVVIRIISTM